MRLLITIIFLVFSVQTSSQEISSGSLEKYSGFFKKNDIEMSIKDAYALWDKKINRLVIYIFPTKISVDEEKKINEQEAFFVIGGKRSPEENKWQWYPFARIILDFDSEGQVNKESLKTFYITMTGIEKQGWNENHRWPNNPNIYTNNTIEIDMAKGYPVLKFSSKYKDHNKYPDDVYWDFNIITPLISSEKIDLSNRK